MVGAATVRDPQKQVVISHNDKVWVEEANFVVRLTSPHRLGPEHSIHERSTQAIFWPAKNGVGVVVGKGFVLAVRNEAIGVDKPNIGVGFKRLHHFLKGIGPMPVIGTGECEIAPTCHLNAPIERLMSVLSMVYIDRDDVGVATHIFGKEGLFVLR